jgi:hypothetical protein
VLHAPLEHATCWHRGTHTPWLPAPFEYSHTYPVRHDDCPCPGFAQSSRHEPCGVHHPVDNPRNPPHTCSVSKHTPEQYPPGHDVMHSALPRMGW